MLYLFDGARVYLTRTNIIIITKRKKNEMKNETSIFTCPFSEYQIKWFYTNDKRNE